MNTLEEQISEYANFVVDETKRHETQKGSSNVGITTNATVDRVSRSKRSRYLVPAFVATLLAATAGSITLVATGNRKETTETVSPRFAPVLARSVNHYAPSYLPPGVTLVEIGHEKVISPRRGIDRLIVLGRVVNARVVDAILVGQSADPKDLYTDDPAVDVENQQIDGVQVRVESSKRAVSIIASLPGCGAVALVSPGQDREAVVRQLSNLACHERTLVVNKLDGLELLFDGPYLRDSSESFRLGFTGGITFRQTIASLPGPVFDVVLDIVNQIDNEMLPTQDIGGRSVRLIDSANYRWSEDDLIMSVATGGDVSKEEITKMIASIRKLSASEWASLIKEHPVKESCETFSVPTTEATDVADTILATATTLASRPVLISRCSYDIPNPKPGHVVTFENAQQWDWVQPSEAMAPTAAVSSHWIVTKPNRSFKRGDLVLINVDSNGTQLVNMKRIVGLPGETVVIEDNKVVVNGERINEPYLAPDTETVPGKLSTPIVLQADEYIVLGDNRLNSNDSRFGGGPTTASSIVGLVVGPHDDQNYLPPFDVTP
jgi:signal peptidase I